MNGRKDAAGGTRRGGDGAASGRRPTAQAVDQSGRPLGPRALQTRVRLLDATHALLKERSVRDLSVVEIARRAGTSPATFYQYFRDVEEATLHLAQQAADEMPGILEQIDTRWRGQRGLDAARGVVDAFVRHWDEHHAVLLFRNLAADQGDRRFRKVRIRALYPVIEELARRIEESRAAGRVPAGMDPHAAAAALASILERLAAHYHELEYFGTTREKLVETCARILYQTVTGRAAP
jgi:AcrR family transcriptional regulator